MQRSQVFKVKGMQRDLSMANASGDFAYEIVNMRLMPAEDGAGFSLTNEKGTLDLRLEFKGTVIGQCPTNDSLVFFTVDSYPEDRTKPDYIYELWEGIGEDPEENDYSEVKWRLKVLYNGDLNFSGDYPIEALFNYETEDIQKIYWIDGLNQLRCINIANLDKIKENNNTQFDSVKEVNSIPEVTINSILGGTYTAGVLQYYITYFSEFGAESPIVYTSPLLYLSHEDRGGNANDKVAATYKLQIDNLDKENWDNIRIYCTHRTSLDAAPEASLLAELKIPDDGFIEFADIKSTRISITSSDLHFTGGKFVKAGTMTIKDQVLFLGHLEIEGDKSLQYTTIRQLFDELRTNTHISGKTIDDFFSTSTYKLKENKLSEYEDSYYHYKHNLNNTESITHYKYNEKYRFGISLLDRYGVWSNPIYLKDAYINIAPLQMDSNTLMLSCPSLDIDAPFQNNKTLWETLQDLGARDIRALVAYPSLHDRKVLAQGVVCPTVYNLKDRKENGPYAQASWFMRPNAPVDLWGIRQFPVAAGDNRETEASGYSVYFNNTGYAGEGREEEQSIPYVYHYSDIITSESCMYLKSSTPNNPSNDPTIWIQGYNENDLKAKDPRNYLGYFGVVTSWEDHKLKVGTTVPAPSELMIDDGNRTVRDGDKKLQSCYYAFWKNGKAWTYISNNNITIESDDPQGVKNFARNILPRGSWVEFRHNYALRPKGWTFGGVSGRYSEKWHGMPFLFGMSEWKSGKAWDGSASDAGWISGGYRCAEIGATASHFTLPVNLIWKGAISVGDPGAPTFLDAKVFRYPKHVTMHNQSKDDWDIEKIYNTGNSAYYVDCSIVTLNSPEIELSDELHNFNFENYKFRIIGCIPLTATVSDADISIKNPSSNLLEKEVGVKKVKVTNKNIGHHGFKGMVASNCYFSNIYDNKDEMKYRAEPLNPWQITGNVTAISSEKDNYGNKNLLEKKIISNLRYSASTFYFDTKDFALEEGDDRSEEITEFSNLCISDNLTVGWKPANDSVIAAWTNTEDTTSIIKLQNSGLPAEDLVYRGNVDSIAIASNEGGTLLDSYVPYNKRDPLWVEYHEVVSFISHIDFGRDKGASIKYKSSPHFVVAFKPFSFSKAKKMWSYSDDPYYKDRMIQEVLPAFHLINNTGLYNSKFINVPSFDRRELYESSEICGLHHQSSITYKRNYCDFGLPGYDGYVYDTENYNTSPSYGWLWLGEIYKDIDNNEEVSEFDLMNTTWEVGGTRDYFYSRGDLLSNVVPSADPESKVVLTPENLYNLISFLNSGVFRLNIQNATITSCDMDVQSNTMTLILEVESAIPIEGNVRTKTVTIKGEFETPLYTHLKNRAFPSIVSNLKYRVNDSVWQNVDSDILAITHVFNVLYDDESSAFNISLQAKLLIPNGVEYRTLWRFDWTNVGLIYTSFGASAQSKTSGLCWTIGDTYYQRFDTLKTFAASDKAENSIIDITSFMVETRINTAGRTDRNRGQENSTTMSPTNFNLFNNVYNQTDNFFTYFILDDDVDKRKYFPNQITWSLSKSAGETVDAWLNVTLASVLDLDGTKGKLTALTTYNNNILALQETGTSVILFNSRVQIPTSESVPIQIANSGKVDGQQFISNNVGCQDKFALVTTPNGLYWADYYRKTIYRFNGQIEDISTPGGFRGWCNKNITSSSQIKGYYDVKNKEVMFYGENFENTSIAIETRWLGYSEITNAFSSFYTYPKASLNYVMDKGIWLRGNSIYLHQEGAYNTLLGAEYNPYGINVIVRQDSNILKTFNTVEFRADSYDDDGIQHFNTFDTLSIFDENNDLTFGELEYKPYRPSSLKKYLRTWKANIPRVNNKYNNKNWNRYTNQWARVGLWKIDHDTEKTILHDMAVWYSE